MSKKMRLTYAKGWENFLTGDYIGRVTEKEAQRRARWIDATICEHIPKWKAWLVYNFPWSSVAWLVMERIEIENCQLFGEYGVRTRIIIGGRQVGSRKWKI